MRALVSLLDYIYRRWIALAGAFDYMWKAFYRRTFRLLIKVDYDPKGEKMYQRINILNIDFDFIIIFAFFMAVLALVFIL